MADYYQSKIANNGSFLGRTLIQAKGSIGGSRNVFVHMNDGDANQVRQVPTGCIIKNPFKGFAKAYCFDLVEYNLDGTGYILKTFEVRDAVTSGTSIKIVRNGYRHVPFVGDILMIAPSTLTGTGTAVTVTAVTAGTDATGDYWQITVSSAITPAAGDILVEAAEAGSGKQALVKNPNAFFPCDADFIFDPNAGADEFEKAKYFFTPCYLYNGPIAWIDKMSPLPPAVKALNKSLVNGWFHL
ncbi:MAG: hypothetical protein HUK08_05330 [Bacteroidaceae bacterium]|nr:hypothetical protein [Bacteroidaceae bacterium]